MTSLLGILTIFYFLYEVMIRFIPIFNILLFLLTIYQANLGLTIKKKLPSDPENIKIAKKHSNIGKSLVFIAPLYYFGTMAIIFNYKKETINIINNPFQLLTILFIVLLILDLFVSMKLKHNVDSFWGKYHFKLGIVIIGLYIIQLLLGLKAVCF